MNRVMITLVQFYRSFLSVFFGGNCRFYPSCSEYAQQAYSEKSFVRATVLVITRLSKCHPLGGSGYDPVPVSNLANKLEKRELV